VEVLANVHVSKLLTQQNLKLSFIEKALPVIEKGYTYNLITQKVINPYGFILQILKNGDIEDLYIATYSMNIKAIEILSSLIDEGRIKKLTIILNHNMKFKMKGKDVVLLKMVEERENVSLIKKYTHAKVTLIKQGEDYIIISGSGNYSENPKIEQYTINNDKELYEFHKSWMLE